MSTENNTTNRKRSMRTLWIMVLLFGLPYVAAFYFYINRDTLAPEMATNYGTIITPARPILEVPLTRIDNTIINSADLKGKWLLVSIGSSYCNRDCLDNLYKLRQIKKAVGQEHKRIRKIFFLKDTGNLVEFKKLLGDYRGMDVFLPEGKDYFHFLAGFHYQGGEVKDGVFIVDPLGNYMMMYPPGADAMKMLRDIERLLKVSRIG